MPTTLMFTAPCVGTRSEPWLNSKSVSPTRFSDTAVHRERAAFNALISCLYGLPVAIYWPNGLAFYNLLRRTKRIHAPPRKGSRPVLHVPRKPLPGLDFQRGEIDG